MDNNASQQEKAGRSEATFADIPVDYDSFVTYESDEQVTFGAGKQSTDIREKFANLKTKAAPTINWMQENARKMGARNTAGVWAYWVINVTFLLWLIGTIYAMMQIFSVWQAYSVKDYLSTFNLHAEAIRFTSGTIVFPLDVIGMACAVILGIIAASKVSPIPRKILIIVSGVSIATGFVFCIFLMSIEATGNLPYQIAGGMVSIGFIVMVVSMMWESKWLAIRLLVLMVAILFEDDIIVCLMANGLFLVITILAVSAVTFAYAAFKIQQQGENVVSDRIGAQRDTSAGCHEAAFESMSLSAVEIEQLAPSAFIPDAMFAENANDIISANGGYVKIERVDNMPKAELTWDEYFMAIASLSMKRSKDPNTQVGACIVSDDNRILSIGYNGAPNGFDDSVFPWAREAEHELDTKYPFVVHAEENAILNFRGTKRDLEGAKVYVTLFPCNECAKTLVQSGIKEVIFLSDKYADSVSTLASKKLLDACGVTYRQLKAEKNIELTI